jgi:ATP-dependent Lon protease
MSIQGPMGNGKTTLVKEGIAKALNRPFAFISLGGASDSSYLNGHSFTYEGSMYGRIVDILIKSKCMNPVIYFDELDKVSETTKGDEIISLLTHITDFSQNDTYQDNYFSGIDLDLSKVLFIFSFNDESKINKILKDRMNVINTKGFKTDDKIKITHEFLLTKLYSTYKLSKEDVIFTDEIIEYIITKNTGKEEGVRNLQRCLETILSKINMCNLCSNDDSIIIPYKMDNFGLPITLSKNIIDKLLVIPDKTDSAPPFMYM